MDNDFNNGLIIGGLLGLTIIKRFEHGQYVELPLSFPDLSPVTLGVDSMDLLLPGEGWLLQHRQVEIAAEDVSINPLIKNIIELEVLPR